MTKRARVPKMTHEQLWHVRHYRRTIRKIGQLNKRALEARRSRFLRRP